MSVLVCWNCGTSLADVPLPISRHANCSKCFNELHCCRLCQHFEPDSNTNCLEDRADPPMQKENANFCEFFLPQSDAFKGATADQSASAKNELDSLFNTPEEDASQAHDAPSPEDNNQALSKEAEAKQKLDDLFG